MKRNYHPTLARALFAIVFAFSVLIYSISPAIANNEDNQWELVGQFGGSTQAVAVVKNTAYIGVGLRLNVVDIGDPSQPKLIGMSETFSDMIFDVAIQENIAYIAAGKAGLQIIDLTDPRQPKRLGEWNSVGFAEGVAVSGEFVLLANGPAGISVINIKNASSPQQVGRVYPDHYVFDVLISGSHAYAAAADSGLLVLDVEDFNQTREIGQLDTYGYAYEIARAGNLLFIADAWEGVVIADLSDPASPRQLANLTTSGWSLGVAVSGSSLVSLNGVQGCDIFDLKDPTNPVKAGSYLKEPSEGDTSARRAVIRGEYIYLADTINGLRVLDVSDPGAAFQVGNHSQLSYARRVIVQEDYAYVATASEGAMYVINIADPVFPYQISKFQADGIAVDVVINGNYATLGTFEDSSNCYTVIDISNPAHPSEASAMGIQNPQCGSPRQMVAVNDFVYSADEDGLSVMDLTNPGAIKTIGRIDLQQEGHQTVALAVSGDYAYVADAGAGLKIVNIADPAELNLVKIYSTGNTVGSITIDGDILYIGQYGMGITAAANTNPGGNPATLGNYQTTGSVEEAAAFGNILVTSEGNGGLEILDISDPARIQHLQTIRTPGFAWASFVIENLIIVASGDAGLLLYQKQSASSASSAVPVVFPVSTTSAIKKRLGSEAPAFPKNVKKVTSSNTCVVNTSEDSGSGSLRECLKKAVAGETITFDPTVFPPSNPSVIALRSRLPDLDDGSITIDGSHAGVILDGGQQVPVGLKISTSFNTIMGIQFTNFTMDGITLDFPGQMNQIGGDHTMGEASSGQGNVFYGNQNAIRVLFSSHNIILGNFVGTNGSGTRAEAPNSMGIVLSNYATYNIIGGASIGEKNIISNNGRGVDIASNTASFNVVAGNYIGTDITGTRAIPNTDWGVLIEVGGRNNTIGGTTPEERNIISGNFSGVDVSDYGSSQNSIVGNFIGTDVTGTKPLPNKEGSGVFQSLYNRIGGTRPGEANLISANSEKGVRFFGMGAIHALLLGNTIGLDAGGVNALPNLLAITMDGGNHGMIGGLGKGSGNTIAGNVMGIAISYAGTTNNWVAGNAIKENQASGISINNFASGNFVVRNMITGSNPGVLIIQGNRNLVHANSISGNHFTGIEIREGGNLELPAPIIHEVTAEGIFGTACPYCVIEVFSDPEEQGLTYEGFTMADSEGDFEYLGKVTGPMVTATATDQNGNTSQFSNSVATRD